MQLLNAEQIRNWDLYTIENEPIASVNLMERASQAFVQRLQQMYDKRYRIVLFCGKGNNGGDGLAIARILSKLGYSVTVKIVHFTNKSSSDFDSNLSRIPKTVALKNITSSTELPHFTENTVVVDALLGSGLTRPIEGLLKEVIDHINSSTNPVISVDIASGLYCDIPNNAGDTIIRPHHTITFQVPKRAFMIPSNDPFVGEWHVVDILLHPGYLATISTPWQTTDHSDSIALVQKRTKFSHKGTYGHALLIAGSYGKIGAAILAGKSCLRSGVGMLTLYTPACGYVVLQTSLPEAMLITDPSDKTLSQIPEISNYMAIGIGPGIGTSPETQQFLIELLPTLKQAVVLDADALNILALHPYLLKQLPPQTILTPHPKEFERLFGKSNNHFESIELGQQYAQEYNLIICLKGAHTAVICPNGHVYFNTTGNPGMAKAGSGDTLTGIITALLAQGYTPEHAARIGVFKHGEAADRTLKYKSAPAMLASDFIEHLVW